MSKLVKLAGSVVEIITQSQGYGEGIVSYFRTISLNMLGVRQGLVSCQVNDLKNGTIFLYISTKQKCSFVPLQMFLFSHFYKLLKDVLQY